MGLIVHNVSTPDDGLGDALRTGFVNQNTMNAELYSTAVFKVAGYDLSKNDFTDALLTKLNALDINAEPNVNADWAETDPTSAAYIFNKPVFASTDILVSALWTGTGLDFDVTADAFPISGVLYAATPATVTLDASDATLDRIDLIIATAPISPATIGTVGKITGTPATPSLVVPPDFDPATQYVIKQITVKAAATTPDGVSNTQIYNEGTEWTVALSGNITQTTNDPSAGTNCLEGTNVTPSDYMRFTAPSVLSTADIGVLAFDVKLKADFGGSVIFVNIKNGSTIVGSRYFTSGQNGFVSSNLSYQTIYIDKTFLNLPVADFDTIDILFFSTFDGFYFDNFELFTGSGSETVPETGIQDAPIDGVLYSRKDGAWSAIPDFVRADIASTRTAGSLIQNDNVKLEIGTAGAECEIYSDGTDSLMNLKSGDYRILDNGVVRFIFTRTTGATSFLGNMTINSGGASPLTLTRGAQVGMFLNDTTAPRYLGASAGQLYFGANANYITNALVYTSANLTEELILGTAVYNATLTGTPTIDLNSFSTYRGILTGNTVVTFSNTPASGKSTVKTMLLTGNFTLSFSDADYIIGAYSGTATMNRVTIELTNYPTAGLLVTVTYENIA